MRMDNSKTSFKMKHLTEDFSPMEGVGNMADAMLVFACGLLLALIISWNVDVSETGEIKKQPNATEDLKDMGRVYQDPKTGKYYVVEE